jgi:hypothetical protein
MIGMFGRGLISGYGAIVTPSVSIAAGGDITMGSGAKLKLDPSTSITDCPLQWNGDPNHGYSYIAADQSSIVCGGGNKLNITSTAASFNVGLTVAAGNMVVSSGYLQLTEMAAPGAGAADTVRIYAAVDGGSLTDLEAVFQDGTVVEFAQET